MDVGGIGSKGNVGQTQGLERQQGSTLDPKAKELFGGRTVRSEEVSSPLKSWNYRPGVSLGEKASHLGHRVLRTVTGWFSKGSAKATRAMQDHAKYMGKALDAMRNCEVDRFRFYFGKMRGEGSEALKRGATNTELMTKSLAAYLKGVSGDELLALAREVNRQQGSFEFVEGSEGAHGTEDLKLLKDLVKGMMREGADEKPETASLDAKEAVAPPEVEEPKAPTLGERAQGLLERMGTSMARLFGAEPPRTISTMSRSEIETLDEEIRQDCEELGILQDKVLDTLPKTLRDIDGLKWESPFAVRGKLEKVLEQSRAPLGEAIKHVTQTMHERVRDLATSSSVVKDGKTTGDRFAQVMSKGQRVVNNLTARYEALARAAQEVERHCVLKDAMYQLETGLKLAQRKDMLDEEVLTGLGKVADLVDSMVQGYKPEAMSLKEIESNLDMVIDLAEEIPMSLQRRLGIEGELQSIKDMLGEVRDKKSEMPPWAEKFGKDAQFMRECLEHSTDLYASATSVRNAKTLSSANGLQAERFNKSFYEFLGAMRKSRTEGRDAFKVMERDYRALVRGVGVAYVEASMKPGDHSAEIEALDGILESARELFDKGWEEFGDVRPFGNAGEGAAYKARDVGNLFAEVREARTKDFGPSIKGLLTAFEGAVASGRKDSIDVLEDRINYCEDRGKFGEGPGKYPPKLLTALRGFVDEAKFSGRRGSDRLMRDLEETLQEAGISDKLKVHDARVGFGGELKLLVNRDKTFTGGGPQALKWVTLPWPPAATPRAYTGTGMKEGHGDDKVGYSFKQEANRLKPLSRLSVDQYAALYESLAQKARS